MFGFKETPLEQKRRGCNMKVGNPSLDDRGIATMYHQRLKLSVLANNTDELEQAVAQI